MGAAEVTRFLSALAVEGKVAASTQNQALSALLFLYGEVLAVDLPWMDEIVRVKRPQRLRVVLTRDEVRAGSGSSSAATSASRTWSSGRTRSSCGAARATRTA